MSRDLDDLMNADPLELSDQDIDDIIAYNRKLQSNAEDGVKTKTKGKPVDLTALGLIKSNPIDRRGF